jgi:hypothetical protein
MKRGYEYEMMIARVDLRNAAVRVSNLSLASSSGYKTQRGVGICGLRLSAIRVKRVVELDRPRPAGT